MHKSLKTGQFFLDKKTRQIQQYFKIYINSPETFRGVVEVRIVAAVTDSCLARQRLLRVLFPARLYISKHRPSVGRTMGRTCGVIINTRLQSFLSFILQQMCYI